MHLTTIRADKSNRNSCKFFSERDQKNLAMVILKIQVSDTGPSWPSCLKASLAASALFAEQDIFVVSMLRDKFHSFHNEATDQSRICTCLLSVICLFIPQKVRFTTIYIFLGSVEKILLLQMFTGFNEALLLLTLSQTSPRFYVSAGQVF